MIASVKLRYMVLVAVACCIVLMISCGIAEDAQQPSHFRSISESKEVIAVINEDYGLYSSEGPRLVLVIWGDGKIIWSKNRVEGGAPFRCGRISAEQWSFLTDKLVDHGVFHKDHLHTLPLYVHGKHTRILIQDGERRLDVCSNHELSEGWPRKDFTVFQKADLVDRLLWAEIRLQLEYLLPLEDESASGSLHLQHGVYEWRD